MKRDLLSIAGDVYGLERAADAMAGLLDTASKALHEGDKEKALRCMREAGNNYSGLFWGYLDELIAEVEKAE